MIKFFRNIRKKLLSEGKTSRYLTYAFGEIILVVIGILIALSINNWNDTRKERMFEHKLLREMKTALEKDIYFFDNHLIKNRMEVVQKAASFFKNYLITDSIASDSIDLNFNLLTRNMQITYNKGPYEALKSTGIDKIKNDSLRNQIINLYEFSIPRSKGLVELYLQSSSEEMEVLEERLRMETAYSIVEGEVIFDYSSLKPIDLKNNKDFLTLLSWADSRSKSAIFGLNILIRNMQETVDKIDAELESF